MARITRNELDRINDPVFVEKFLSLPDEGRLYGFLEEQGINDMDVRHNLRWVWMALRSPYLYSRRSGAALSVESIRLRIKEEAKKRGMTEVEAAYHAAASSGSYQLSSETWAINLYRTVEGL